MDQTQHSQTLSVREKVAYGMGDAAAGIVFQVVINFLLYFYTDVYGITAAAAGTLLLVIRLFDAFTDPLMGGIADRTKTRWGSFRPYLLWMAVPYGVMAVFAFTTPDLDDSGKLIYAYITYGLLMLFYTATNIPYSALGGVMTSSKSERASIQSYRFALAMIGGAIVTASVLPLVSLLGQGDEQLGFQLAMIVLGTLAAICFFICFAFTKERLPAPTIESSASIMTDVKLTLKNDQWRLIALITFILLVAVAMKGGVTPFYVEYYLGRPDKIGEFLTIPMLFGVLGALSTNYLSKKMCKATIMKYASIGVLVIHIVLFFVPPEYYMLALIVTCIANFVHMIFIPLIFSTIPDCVDYGKEKLGRAAMAMSFSGHLLALKFGIAIGGACTGWLLSYVGYVPKAAQTDTALSGIVMMFCLSSALAGILTFFVLRFYKLTQQKSASVAQTAD